MESRNSRDSQPNNTPKFNSYWIYGLVALLLLALNFYSLSNTNKKPIEWGRFEQMLRAGDVQELDVINKETAHVYIKSDRLEKSEYGDANQSSLGAPRPHYKFEIGSVESFEAKLERAQEDVDKAQSKINEGRALKSDAERASIALGND